MNMLKRILSSGSDMEDKHKFVFHYLKYQEIICKKTSIRNTSQFWDTVGRLTRISYQKHLCVWFFTRHNVWTDIFQANVFYQLYLEWSNKIPGNTQLFLGLHMHAAHSVWATAQVLDPACGHGLKGKHTVKQVAFSMFIKRVVALLVQIVLVM